MNPSFTSPQALFDFLQLETPPDYFNPNPAIQFKFLVPFSFAQRMQKKTPSDPLLLQVLPHFNELIEYPGYVDDPLSESQLINPSGLLQKYQHRLLLMPTSACGIHCRYCFRRNFPYQSAGVNLLDVEKKIIQISQVKEISEVILSGGDPLCLDNHKLSVIFAQLQQLKTLKRLRIHTRQLIVDPQRINHTLIDLIAAFPLPIAIVLHCNHPNELSSEVKDALQLLRIPNVQLLNQSVLLKGVNDNANVLINLSEKLYDCGILPYYLHQLDPVSGSQHFAISDLVAVDLMQQMQIKLPGYLVPNLVREIDGLGYKQRIDP